MKSLKKVNKVFLIIYLLIGFMIIESVYAQNIIMKLSSIRYIDPMGFFKIIPPNNWKIQKYPNEVRGKIKFYYSKHISLLILAKSSEFRSFEKFYINCETISKERLISFGAKNLQSKKLL